MKRLVELDVLRGFLLLMMVVNHAPSPLRRITDQPLGFFSTAEGFVFVSAFLAGLLFQKRAETKGFAAARTATFLRAFRIYQAHLATVFFIFFFGKYINRSNVGIFKAPDYDLNKATQSGKNGLHIPAGSVFVKL